jgi:hypothetical protein
LERSVAYVKVVFLYEACTTETHSWMLIGEGVATVIENHHFAFRRVLLRHKLT